MINHTSESINTKGFNTSICKKNDFSATSVRKDKADFQSKIGFGANHKMNSQSSEIH
jgi:hypothetical protein